MAMDERYRLVFRGEVLEGQHKAVVKRRLTELMKLDEARLEKLFSGSPVVVKRDVDRKTAARYQALFKQAGGRLRVLAEQPGNDVAQDTAAPAPGRTAAAAPTVPAAPAAAAAPGSPTGSTLTIVSSYFPPPAEPAPEIQAPEFGVAEVGATLLEAVESPPVVVPEADFELAEVGADLLPERVQATPPEIGFIDFEVAEVGADLGPGDRGEAIAPPDVSHIQLAEA